MGLGIRVGDHGLSIIGRGPERLLGVCRLLWVWQDRFVTKASDSPTFITARKLCPTSVQDAVEGGHPKP